MTKHDASELWAILADDDSKPPLAEGICGMVYPIPAQFVTIHRSTLNLMIPQAREIAKATGKRLRVVRFVRAEVEQEL